MKLRNFVWPFFLLFFVLTLGAQTPSQILLDKSITYHDPNDNWEKWQAELNFSVLYPGKPDAKRYVSVDNKKDNFAFKAEYKEGILDYKVMKGIPIALWNESETIPLEMEKQYRISKDRALMYRNYYTYLYGMPMKLKDPGTQIDPKVEAVSFYGKEYNRIKVTYEQGVGKDTWYFYFEPTTNALQAYQFFKDESKNDGEYILFEGEIIKDGIKIPKDRKWYYNKDEKYLATDVLN